MPITPIGNAIPFPGILSFSSPDNTSNFPLVETKNVRGGIVFPASDLAAAYPGTGQDTASTVVPFSSLGFEGTNSGDFILKVCVSGGGTEGNAQTQWEPLSDYLGTSSGSFMLAQAANVTQNFGDNAGTHTANTPSVLRFGVGADHVGSNDARDGLVASIKDEVADSDSTPNTLRFSLTNAPNLGTVLTAGNYAANTGVSNGSSANVLGWSASENNGQLIPSPIQVSSNGTIFTTTVTGNLVITGSIDQGSVVQANTLSVNDKFITLNDNFTTEYSSIDDMTSAQSTGGILVQIGAVDDNSDGDVTDLGEIKYKAFYWDAGTGNWSFADAVDADGDGDGNADGFTFSNVNILASKSNIVDLHFGDTVTTPSANLEYSEKFVTPSLLTTYLQYNITEPSEANATVPAVPTSTDNVLNFNTEGDTFVRFARIWHVSAQVTQNIIDSKKMYINIPRDEDDDYYAKPPVVKGYRSTTHGNDTDQNVREEVMTNIKIREINGAQDRIEIFFAQWPGSAAGGLSVGDVLIVRILH